LPVSFIVNQLTLRPGTTLYNQLAPSLNKEKLPCTWQEVEEVNKRYRQQFGSSLDDTEAALRRYPNYLGNQFM
jgi:anaerobic magnesium-protoporphyrin IX monomethyl ester cyclase